MRPLVLIAATVALLAVGTVSARADAHALGVSNGRYGVDETGVVASTTFSRAEIDAAAARADLPAFAAAASVTAGGRECRLTGATANDVAEDGVALSARYECEGRPRDVTVTLGWLDRLAHGHRHLARVTGVDATTGDFVAFRGEPTFSLRLEGAPTTTSGDRDREHVRGAGVARALGFVRMGVEHILGGYDHLLFLFALVLVQVTDRSRVRQMLAVVTAFTVAHSITLAAATLGFFTPDPRWVEPLIALSVAYVGLENLLRARGRAAHRWRLTFLFGLVHGLGFAGALSEVGLAARDVPVALVGFNLGVELGQLAVMGAILPFIVLLGRRERAFVPSVRVLSGAVVVAGLVWFFERAFGA